VTVRVAWGVLFLALIVTAPRGLAQSRAKPVQTKAAADSAQKVPKYPSPRGALWRALVFPGWGQWYNGKKWKAVLVFTAEFGLIGAAVYWNQKVQSARNTYDREFFVNNRNLSNWWLLFTVFMSATDAYVDAQLANFDVSPDLSARPGSLTIGIRVSFR